MVTALLSATQFAFGDNPTTCGTFLRGGACHPNVYVDLLTNATEDECRGACEVQEEQGCCWHSPKPNGADCQWAGGSTAQYYGQVDVRSAANCSGGRSDGLPVPQQVHSAFGQAVDE